MNYCKKFKTVAVGVRVFKWVGDHKRFAELVTPENYEMNASELWNSVISETQHYSHPVTQNSSNIHVRSD